MGLGWEQRGETLVLGTDLVTERNKQLPVGNRNSQPPPVNEFNVQKISVY
jgi:hypothetical protein